MFLRYFSSIQNFFRFFCFPNIIMFILNIASAIRKIAVNELRDSIFENYYKQIGFSEENSYYTRKHQEKKDLQLIATKLTEKNV